MRALIVAAALLAFGGATAQAETLKIHPQVWAWYQEYLGLIGSTRPGAYAVAKDGRASGGMYCQELRCDGNRTYSSEAIQECEKHSDGVPCVIFAQGREIVVEYEVAE